MPAATPALPKTTIAAGVSLSGGSFFSNSSLGGGIAGGVD
jgi:hypothetical protein